MQQIISIYPYKVATLFFLFKAQQNKTGSSLVLNIFSRIQAVMHNFGSGQTHDRLGIGIQPLKYFVHCLVGRQYYEINRH